MEKTLNQIIVIKSYQDKKRPKNIYFAALIFFMHESEFNTVIDIYGDKLGYMGHFLQMFAIFKFT